MKLEAMDTFFSVRLPTYDEHMLENVMGCRRGYELMPDQLPTHIESILDLGCGTGLELKNIFERFSRVTVTCVDLCEEMLSRLLAKYPDKSIIPIKGSYIARDFGNEVFDSAISFQTMHHMTMDVKLSVYKNIFKSIKPGGRYVECDYMVTEQALQDELLESYVKLKDENGITDDGIYHYDIPCTIDNQIKLMEQAGFKNVEMVWREGNTTMMVAYKE